MPWRRRENAFCHRCSGDLSCLTDGGSIYRNLRKKRDIDKIDAGPGPHGAPPPPPAAPRRTPKRTAAEVDEELPEVQSQEQAADSRVERLAGRAEGRRAAAEKAEEVVGARPIHITSQLGLVAQRRLRARGWEARGESLSPVHRTFVSGCEGPRHRGIA